MQRSFGLSFSESFLKEAFSSHPPPHSRIESYHLGTSHHSSPSWLPHKCLLFTFPLFNIWIPALRIFVYFIAAHPLAHKHHERKDLLSFAAIFLGPRTVLGILKVLNKRYQINEKVDQFKTANVPCTLWVRSLTPLLREKENYSVILKVDFKIEWPGFKAQLYLLLVGNIIL